MKRRKLIAGVVIATIGGLAIIGIANATATVKHYDNNISYTLNDGTPTEQLFTGVGTITIIEGEDIITMLDRNLGATEAGTGCDKDSNGGYCPYDETYGYHFQRGNNYGFKPGCDLSGSTNTCSDSITSSAIQGEVSVSMIAYNPLKQEYYSSPIFIRGSTNWLNDNSKVDLRGGSGNDYGGSYPLTAESALARRGPCPEGFHVPSYGELYKIKTMMGSARNVHNDLLVPFAGYRHYEDAEVHDLGSKAALRSSSPQQNSQSRYLFFSLDENMRMGANPRTQNFSVRCVYDSYQTYTKFISYIEPTNSGLVTTLEGAGGGVGGGDEVGLPDTMTVTTNNVVNVEGDKPVVGEVSVSFGENVSAKFSDLVKVNIPVEDHGQVIIKVKHAGSSGYNFDGLTTNANASCDANGRPTSSPYNGELITVVNGFASIYTCEASDFVALGLDDGGNPQITVNIAEFNGGQNTCSGSNFFFSGITAGTITTRYVLTGVFSCDFGNGGSHPLVTLQLSGDLKAGDIILSGENIKMQNSEWTSRPTGLKSADTLIDEWKRLKNSTQTLFTKTANLIGVASGVVSVQVTVPAGQPEGTYVGTLVLTY